MCLTFRFDEMVFVQLQIKAPLEVIVFVYCGIIDNFSLAVLRIHLTFASEFHLWCIGINEAFMCECGRMPLVCV